MVARNRSLPYRHDAKVSESQIAAQGSPLTGRRRTLRKLAVVFWRLVNPPTRLAAGFAPWWVLVETTGHRTGKRRRTPIATGPIDSGGMWLIAAHGRHASWVRTLEVTPSVRVRTRGRWRTGSAIVHEFDPSRVAAFNVYARQAARRMGIDPALVRIEWAGPN